VRQVRIALGLVPAGGNYRQIQAALVRYGVSTSHFRGRAWNKGGKGHRRPTMPLDAILVVKSSYQSSRPKKRLIMLGLKDNRWERCGWAASARDGRVPVELDHVNGD
jgi:hypothetical protein